MTLAEAAPNTAPLQTAGSSNGHAAAWCPGMHYAKRLGRETPHKKPAVTAASQHSPPLLPACQHSLPLCDCVLTLALTPLSSSPALRSCTSTRGMPSRPLPNTVNQGVKIRSPAQEQAVNTAATVDWSEPHRCGRRRHATLHVASFRPIQTLLLCRMGASRACCFQLSCPVEECRR